jgi:Zn-dependent membrane protease YugP
VGSVIGARNDHRAQNDLSGMQRASGPDGAADSRDQVWLARLTTAAVPVVIVTCTAAALVGIVAIAHRGATLMTIGAAMVASSIVCLIVGLVIVFHIRIAHRR